MTDPRIEAAARVRMAEEECSYPINVHPEQCVCEAHGTPFEGMALGVIYGHYAYMGGLCAHAVEQATATVAAIEKAATITEAYALAEVPIGTVVRSAAGTIAARFDGYTGVLFGDDRGFPWRDLALPARVIHRAPNEPAPALVAGAH